MRTPIRMRMTRRIAGILSVAALAGAGLVSSSAIADQPPCPPDAGFDAALSHTGIYTAVSAGGLQNNQSVNSSHACP